MLILSRDSCALVGTPQVAAQGCTRTERETTRRSRFVYDMGLRCSTRGSDPIPQKAVDNWLESVHLFGKVRLLRSSPVQCVGCASTAQPC